MQKAEQQEFVRNLVLERQANKAKLGETLAYQEAILRSAKKARQELDPKIMEACFWSAGHWELISGWEVWKIRSIRAVS